MTTINNVKTVSFQNDLSIVGDEKFLRVTIKSLNGDIKVIDIPWRKGMDDLHEVMFTSDP